MLDLGLPHVRLWYFPSMVHLGPPCHAIPTIYSFLVSETASITWFMLFEMQLLLAQFVYCLGEETVVG